MIWVSVEVFRLGSRVWIWVVMVFLLFLLIMRIWKFGCRWFVEIGWLVMCDSWFVYLWIIVVF